MLCLHRECAASAPRVRRECAASAPRVHRDCAVTAPRLRRDCTAQVGAWEGDGAGDESASGAGGAAALAAVLTRAGEEGLDVAGLRLLWLSEPESHALAACSPLRPPPAGGAVVAVALRGRGAVARWRAAVGPEEPAVARRTEPTSLKASLRTDRRTALTCTAAAQVRAAHRRPCDRRNTGTCSRAYVECSYAGQLS
eukprot:1172593-Prorocentrum_minimum.AAC.3